MNDALSPRVAEALRTVTVSPDGRGATVGRRRLSADGAESLRPLLAGAIYEELHAGWVRPDIPAGRSLRDRAADARFRELMPYRDALQRVPVLDASGDDLLVRLDGVGVWMPGERVIERYPSAVDGADDEDGESALVRVPADRPALSSGFFLADSPAQWGPGGSILRVYVHLTSMDAAFAAWSAVLGALAETSARYRVKVASSPVMLPRRDALVLYAGDQDDDLARRVAEAVRDVPGIGTGTSVFARPAAPGVSTAREPADPRPDMRGLSFGEHRSATLAEALTRHAVTAADDGDLTAPDLTAAVRDAFLRAGIDPGDPSRNLP
ncbi:MAG: hypothetical protein J2P25_07070 [Nocardiopsaceae bacterium]|nr:hypothetical protein [Nocardiopsaceae bacterium]